MIKVGERRRKYVTKQGYRCKACKRYLKRYFVEREGFEGMTYPKDIVVEVLHLYVERLYLSKIWELVHQRHSYHIPSEKHPNWTKEYPRLGENLENRVKPRVKGRCTPMSLLTPCPLGEVRQEFGAVVILRLAEGSPSIEMKIML